MSYSGSAGGGIGGVSPASTPQVAAVPGTKILLCKSGVKDKKPDPAGAEYGEVFVNYHSGSPMLCFKDNAGEIVEIKPTRNIDGGGGETPPSTGNEVGDTLWDGTHFRVWDGSSWVAIGPNDLAYVQKVDGGTITNSAGSDVDIPVVNNIQAGLMLPGDKNKLDTYPADAADLEVDLGYTPAADKGTVTNTNGDDAEIPLATGTNAGLMAPGDKNKLDGYPATPGEISGTLDLQAVTDIGNTTTNDVVVGDVTLDAGQSVSTFGWGMQAGQYDPANATRNAVSITTGGVRIQHVGGGSYIQGGVGGADLEFSIDHGGSASFADGGIMLNADGSASFSGQLKASSSKVVTEFTRLAAANSGNTHSILKSATDGSATIGQIQCDGTHHIGGSDATSNITLKADGSAVFAGNVTNVGSAGSFSNIPQNGGIVEGSHLGGGKLQLSRQGSNQIIFQAYEGNNSTPQIEFKNNGSASFGAGNITLNADGSGSFAGNVGIGYSVAGRKLVVSNNGEQGFEYNVGAADGSVAINSYNRTNNSYVDTTYTYGNFRFLTQGDTGKEIKFDAAGAASFGSGNITLNANGSASFAGQITADTFRYSGSAPSPALAGKEIDLVATLHLMAAKLAELGGVDVASLFVANDPAPVTQPAEPADDEGASSESSY